jgi:hypothetical protein
MPLKWQQTMLYLWVSLALGRGADCTYELLWLLLLAAATKKDTPSQGRWVWRSPCILLYFEEVLRVREGGMCYYDAILESRFKGRTQCCVFREFAVRSRRASSPGDPRHLSHILSYSTSRVLSTSFMRNFGLFGVHDVSPT